MDSQSPPPSPSFRSSYAPPPEIAEARCTLKETSAYHDQRLGKRFARIEKYLRGETFEDEPPTGVVSVDDGPPAAVRATPATSSAPQPPQPLPALPAPVPQASAQIVPFPVGSRETPPATETSQDQGKPFDESGIMSKSPLPPEQMRRVASSPDLANSQRPRRLTPSRPDDPKKPLRR